jgi:hypothetical protein
MPERIRNMSKSSRAVVTLLVVAAVFIGLALQQRAFQSATISDQEAQAAVIECVQGWGDEFAESIQARTDENTKVRDAQIEVTAATKEKTEALDAIVRSVILLREVPPRATQERLDVALGEYQDAKARLDAAGDALERALRLQEQVARENPYKAPRVVCDQSGG